MSTPRPSPRRLTAPIAALAVAAGIVWWIIGKADDPSAEAELSQPSNDEIVSPAVSDAPATQRNANSSTSATNQTPVPATGSVPSITPPVPATAGPPLAVASTNATPGSVAIQAPPSPVSKAAPAPDQITSGTVATAPASPPFIAPTPQQMRDQPASMTAAQVLSQQLDPNDPAVQAEAVRILTESADLRKKMAWERARQKGWETEGETRGGGYFVLIDFDGDKPLYHETENVDAAMSIATDQVRNAPLSLNGDGMIIGLWEPGGGVLTTHQEFLSAIGPGVMSRASFQDGNHGSTDHGTHVACTLIGKGFNPLIRGMAPNATLHARNSNGHFAEMLAAAAAGANGVPGLLVSSHSYGGRVGWHYNSWGQIRWYGSYTANGTDADDVDENFGRYDADAASVDGLLSNRPFYLPFFSAGNMRNEGPPAPGGGWQRLVAGNWTAFNYTPGSDPKGDGQYKGGYDTMSFNKTAKNAIMVGAVTDAVRDPDGPGGPARFERFLGTALTTSFSSWGPTDDGRIKPDIVANGWQVTSADDTSNTATLTISGTSMATPTAAGSALLLQQLYKSHFPNYMRGSTLKAVILHTADDLGNTGPDYIYGWGLMNTKAAADVITLHKQTATLGTMREKVLTNNESQVETIFLDGTKPLRVTLCWMDPAGAVIPANLNDSRARVLVNDLNLKVERKNAALYSPYVMPYVGDWTPAKLSAPATTGVNTVDNVEQIYLDVPVALAGDYAITVNHVGALANGQAYSLIVTGNVPPPDIAVTAPSGAELQDGKGTYSFGEVDPGEASVKTFTIRNPGVAQLKDLLVTLDGPQSAEFGITQPASTTLAAGGSTTLSVSFAPAAQGPSPRRAALHIASNDPDEKPFDLNLIGQSQNLVEVRTAWTTRMIGPQLTNQWLNTIDKNGYVAVLGRGNVQVAKVARYAAETGAQLWTQPSGGASSGFPSGIRADAEGNVYVCGIVNGSDGFLAKHRAVDGVILWQKNLSDVVTGLVLDSSENVIICGGRTIKYSPGGAVLWEMLEADFYQGNGVGLDGADNMVVVGFNDNSASPRGVVRKYAAANGATLWSRTFEPDTNPVSEVRSVSVNANGEIAINGIGYIARVNGANGNFLWTKPEGQGFWLGVEILPNGDVYGFGSDFTSSGSLALAKYASATGGTIWEKVVPPDFQMSDYMKDLALDGQGNAVITGGFYDQSDFATTWLTRKHAVDDGIVIWEAIYKPVNGFLDGSLGTPHCIATGRGGRVAVTGPFSDIAGPNIDTVLYATNSALEFAIDEDSEYITVSEPHIAAASGTFADPDGNDTVTLTAQRNNFPFGTITKDDQLGTWVWFLTPTDGPDHSGTVVITGTDGSGVESKAFLLIVSNTPPSIDVGPDVSLTPTQAASFNRVVSFTDPGDDVWTAMVDYGDGSAIETVPVNQAAKSVALNHAYLQTGVYSVAVTVKDGDPDGTTTGIFNVTAQRLIDDWRMLHFGTTQNSGEAANTADVDRDGISNLAEFAFNSDPKGAGGPSLPTPALSPELPADFPAGDATRESGPESSTDGHSYGFFFNEPPGTTGITYGVEYSTDLQTWLPVTDEGEAGEHIFAVPVGTNMRMFMRLIVTATP